MLIDTTYIGINMSTEMTDLKQIEKTLVDKIDSLNQKISEVDGKASKSEMAELQKSILNLKATIAARGEDAERDSFPVAKSLAHWTKGMRKSWAKEFANAMDAAKAWDKAPNPVEVRKAFLEKTNANTNEIDATSGLGMLPTQVDSTINKLVPLYGVARNETRVLPGIHGSININRLTAFPTVNFTNSGASAYTPRDDSSVTPNSAAYAYGNLQPLQATGISVVTEKLIYDAVPGVLEDTAENLAIAFGLFEDTILFTGPTNVNGTAFTGLVNQTIGYNNTNPTARTGTFTVASGNFDPLISMRAFVYPSVTRSPNCKYHMIPSTFAVLQSMKASTSGLYFFDISKNEFVVAGAPVVFNQVMDGPNAALTGFDIGKVPIIFGDMRKAVTMGIGRDTQTRILLERYAELNEIGIRVTEDFNYALVLSNAICKLSITS